MGLSKTYASIFSRGVFRKANDRLLRYALGARGYNLAGGGDLYANGEIFFIEKILGPSAPKLCIDIGANVGDYTRLLLENTSAKLISFEPVPVTFHRLEQNLVGFSDRVTFENKGVGAEDGALTINFDMDALGLASFSEKAKKVSYVKNPESVDVEVVTLDSYCRKNDINEIDFIKIDTEGFEKEVFEGARVVFENIKPRFIQMEFNWHQLFRNTSLNFFAEQLDGYDVYQLVYNGWEKRDPFDPLSNIFQFSNFIFVRR